MIALALTLLAFVPAVEETLPSGATLIHVDRRAPSANFALALPDGSRISGGAPADRLAEALQLALLAGDARGSKRTALELARLRARKVLASEVSRKPSLIAAIAGAPEATARIKELLGRLPKSTGTPEEPAGPRLRGKRVVVIDSEGESLILIARAISPPTAARLPALLAAGATFDILGARIELDAANGLASVTLTSERAAIAKTAKNALGILDKTRHGPSIEAIGLGRKRAATRAAAALADPAGQVSALVSAKLQGRSAASVDGLAADILAASDTEIASAARAFSSGDDLAIIVVAGATQELVKELAGIPGVRDVSVVSANEQ